MFCLIGHIPYSDEEVIEEARTAPSPHINAGVWQAKRNPGLSTAPQETVCSRSFGGFCNTATFLDARYPTMNLDDDGMLSAEC
ncbi:hypothetical protein BDBG_17035 [Blastomyces gilchristii SLH14081]|uniref:Uncharacterized protein n=1 Tax=Blastomyces gilchristii (strain SLH14081) TaxID=559298 RepID=A0A179UKB0_BLAGS|nr:uncharacterized protein BDBG_17035 [Blastomyces gilchristii SLH14081]OAT08424.1 hypothetical protein BDBG_17035 [Blastomyces gilchristii SLH14081]